MNKKENMKHILTKNEHRIVIKELEHRLAKSLIIGFVIINLFLNLI